MQNKILKITLVNMPFAAVDISSIGLTQLKSVLESRFREQVQVEVQYLNHDFAHYMGIAFYNRIAQSGEHLNSGLGDWFFKRVAFPEEPDNTESYFNRCYPNRTERIQKLRSIITEKREGLEQFLDGLIDKYRLDQADIVGFTSTFAQNVGCFAMARKLKERKPELLILMGGANCEAVMGREIIQQVSFIDFAFSGPALKSLPQFIQHRFDNELEKCHSISGVFSKLNCGPRTNLIGIGKPPAQVGEIGEELSLDVRVELDYEPFLRTLKNNFPTQQIKPTLLFETSRGCWWGARAHCTFCGLNGGTMNYRAMSPELAIEQFDALFKYAPECSEYQCVDNIMPKNYVKEVFPFIKTPPNANIFYEVKADLTEEDLQVLAKAGVRSIQPGIEALATSTLKLMKKGTTVFHNLALLKHCVTHQIYPSWNLLIGFPGEGAEVYQKYVQDLPLLTHLIPPSGAFPVRFDRFSPYFVKALEYGLDLHPVDFYSLTYPFSEESLANLAYYFTDRNFRAEYFTTMLQWIGKVREKVDSWDAKWDATDGARQPKLYLKEYEGADLIFDSRSGLALEYRLDPLSKQVLEALNKPKDLVTIARKFNHIPDFDPEKELAFLQERGLVFHEAGRYLNLVHPSEPPTLNLHS